MLRGLFRCVALLGPLLLSVGAVGAKETTSTKATQGSAKVKPKRGAKASKPDAKKTRTAKVDQASKPSRSRAPKTGLKSIKPKVKPRRSDTSRFLEVLPEGELGRTPAYVYANYDNEQAYAELERRGVPFRREHAGPAGVRAPVRLTGALHGVYVHSALPAQERSTSAFEILDARLALALDDFCALLAQREIVELVHYTMYRGGTSPRAETDALPTRHPGGLAIDVGALRKESGEWLDVGPHWRTDIGAKTCGPGAKTHESPAAQELVALVCEAATKHLFHYMLTPHYDSAHDDHLHLEIKPAVKWFLVN